MKKFKDKDAGVMGAMFSIEKKKPSKLRKVPFLPRIGLYIDFAGYEVVFKKVPMLETLLNLPERGVSMRDVIRITKEQFAEVQFPKIRKLRVVNTSARTISVKAKE